MEVSEHMLIEEVLTGDLDAFDRLVVPCNTLLFRCAYLIVRDEKDAEDAVQEAFRIHEQRVSE